MLGAAFLPPTAPVPSMPSCLHFAPLASRDKMVGTIRYPTICVKKSHR